MVYEVRASLPQYFPIKCSYASLLITNSVNHTDTYQQRGTKWSYELLRNLRDVPFSPWALHPEISKKRRPRATLTIYFNHKESHPCTVYMGKRLLWMGGSQDQRALHLACSSLRIRQQGLLHTYVYTLFVRGKWNLFTFLLNHLSHSLLI